MSGDYLVNVDANGAITGHIPFTPGPPPVGSVALGLAREGEIVSYIPWQPL